MVTKLIISKLTKNNLIQVSYLSDFLLKFMPSHVSRIIQDTRFNVSSTVSVRNISFKSRSKLLRLIRIFEPLQHFNFETFTNYNFRHKVDIKAKLFFGLHFPFLCNIIDFYDFFLLKLSARPRALTRSFVYKDFLQINFYEYGLIGFFDQHIDYYGWQEPLLVRIKMCRTTLKKHINFSKFILNCKNYFIFFVLRLQINNRNSKT